MPAAPPAAGVSQSALSQHLAKKCPLTTLLSDIQSMWGNE